MSRNFQQEDSPYPPNSRYVQDASINYSRTSTSYVQPALADDEDDEGRSFYHVDAKNIHNPCGLANAEYHNRPSDSEAHFIGQAGGLMLDAAKSAAGVASAALQTVTGTMKSMWDMAMSESMPLQMRRSRPHVGKYKTTHGAFHEVRRHQGNKQEKILQPKDQSMNPPRLTGLSGSCGPLGIYAARVDCDKIEIAESSSHHFPQIHRNRIARPIHGGLIEISDDEDIDYAEARAAGLYDGKGRVKGAIEGRNEVKAVSPVDGTTPPDSDNDDFSEAEGEDSDFEMGGGVTWPLHRKVKRKHMAKMDARRREEAERQMQLDKEQEAEASRRRREEERERRVKAAIREMRQKEQLEKEMMKKAAQMEKAEEERMNRELEEWPVAHKAKINEFQENKAEAEPDADGGKHTEYPREKEISREHKVERKQLRRRHHVELSEKESDKNALLDPMAHLGLSEQTRNTAQKLFSKDREARRATEGDFIKKIKPMTDALLKR